LIIVAGSASAATVTFGMRSTDNYTGDWKDTHVRAGYPNTNDYSGTYGRLVPEDQHIHYLIDISALPEGAEIMAAKLHFNVHSNYKGNGSFNVELRSLGKNFTDTGDTWNQADKQAGMDWTNNNGGESDSSSAYGSSWQQSGSAGWKEVAFDAVGLAYVNDALAGNGILRLMLFPTMDGADCGTTGCMRIVMQSEWTANESQRPYLEITYTTGGAECDDADERQCGETDMGECEYGTETCNGGAWGSCVGEKGPTAETCRR